MARCISLHKKTSYDETVNFDSKKGAGVGNRFTAGAANLPHLAGRLEIRSALGSWVRLCAVIAVIALVAASCSASSSTETVAGSVSAEDPGEQSVVAPESPSLEVRSEGPGRLPMDIDILDDDGCLIGGPSADERRESRIEEAKAVLPGEVVDELASYSSEEIVEKAPDLLRKHAPDLAEGSDDDALRSFVEDWLTPPKWLCAEQPQDPVPVDCGQYETAQEYFAEVSKRFTGRDTTTQIDFEDSDQAIEDLVELAGLNPDLVATAGGPDGVRQFVETVVRQGPMALCDVSDDDIARETAIGEKPDFEHSKRQLEGYIGPGWSAPQSSATDQALLVVDGSVSSDGSTVRGIIFNATANDVPGHQVRVGPPGLEVPATTIANLRPGEFAPFEILIDGKVMGLTALIEDSVESEPAIQVRQDIRVGYFADYRMLLGLGDRRRIENAWWDDTTEQAPLVIEGEIALLNNTGRETIFMSSKPDQFTLTLAWYLDGVVVDVYVRPLAQERLTRIEPSGGTTSHNFAIVIPADELVADLFHENLAIWASYEAVR